MFRDAREVRELVRSGDKVLDIGGAEEVFPRADVVLDIVPYEGRRPGALREEAECFSAESWFVADICAPEIWTRFADKEFDFVLCSHTLEDVRDPISVCREMIRVGKRGYIECPSRLRECTREEAGLRSAGWPHHRWIVDFEDGHLIFTGKGDWASDFDFAGDRREQCLADYRLQFVGLEWEGSFGYHERMGKGPVIEAENTFLFFAEFPFHAPSGPIYQAKDVAPGPGTFLGHREFLLPVEAREAPEVTLARYRQRRVEKA